MTYTCEGCGRTFETKTSLRLHDCIGSTIADLSGPDLTALYDELAGRNQEERRQRAQRLTGDDLDEAIANGQEGDLTGAVTAVAHLERELTTASERHSAYTFRDVFWGYYEPTVEAVDTVARAEGWPFLTDLLFAYDHREAGELSEVTGVIANVVSREIVRIRLTDDVAAIPEDGLAYLHTVPEYETSTFAIAWEESQHCGWGIGHPEVSVAEIIRDRIGVQDSWVCGAALGALYADQQTAVELYCDILRTSDERAFAGDRLSRLEGDPPWELFPRGSNFYAEFDRDFTFTFDEYVEQQLRSAIEDAGLTDDLSAAWTFEDLELRWR